MRQLVTGLFKLTLLCLALGLVGCGAKTKEPQKGAPPEGKASHEMPAQFTEACSEKSEGDECTVDGKDDEKITGTCHKGPHSDDDALSCMPKGKGGKGHGKPPEKK